MTLVTVHEDLVNEMWSEYLKNVNDYDKRLTDGWKDDANGVLVFVSLHPLVILSITVMIWETGLFSATVASFIIESYKLEDFLFQQPPPPRHNARKRTWKLV